MFRPYRHIPTADLVERRDDLFRKVQDLVARHYASITGDYRRELRRVSRELDRRSEETL